MAAQVDAPAEPHVGAGGRVAPPPLGHDVAGQILEADIAAEYRERKQRRLHLA